MAEKAIRTAIVAGASGDIGRAICKRLDELDYSVVGLGRYQQSSSARLEQQTASAFVNEVAVDFSELSNLSAALDTVSREHPAPDALILALGFGQFGSLEQFSADQIGAMIDVNLTSQLLLLRSFVPVMKRRRQGRIVVVASEAALHGRRYGSVYSATKFGLRGALQALREECASRAVQITVINPGLVRSAFFDSLDFEPAEGEDHALVPADVAAAVVFALSARDGASIDEINMSPLKNAVRQKTDKHNS